MKRRKGSRNTVVALEGRLARAVAVAKELRVKKHKVLPLDARQRYLLMSPSGGRMIDSTVESAMRRLMEKHVRRGGTKFTLHDLKRKGVTDTKGDKMEASGHRSQAMMDVYDVLPALVPPTRD